VLISILVGNTLVNIGSASMATAMAITLFSEAGSAQSVEQGMLWATVTMTTLLLFFGEIAPKSFAIENAERLAPIASSPLALFVRLLGPAGALLERFSDRVITLLSPPQLADPLVSSGELSAAVDLGHYQGVVDAFEREVVSNILELEGRSVGEVMTPRVDVKSLDVDQADESWSAAFTETGYSRLPLVDGDLDRVVGVLYAKDLLSVRLLGTTPANVRNLAREAHFVPESMKVLELLQDMRDRQIHFALVIDEYGSTSGVVTMEDLLEEIVGEIADSRDEEEAPFKLLGPGSAVVYAGWELDEFSEATGIAIEDPNAETVGGWIVNALGRIPQAGETVTLPPFLIHVLSARPNRVLWLRTEWRGR
jgi:CBS domain containing-hemolysin-like protein